MNEVARTELKTDVAGGGDTGHAKRDVIATFEHFEKFIKSLQLRIVTECFIGLGEAQPSIKTWRMEALARERGEMPPSQSQPSKSSVQSAGGGTPMLIEDGEFFERAGVNVSSVSGTLSAETAELLRVAAQPYRACGLSLVFHPHSPWVPSVHANIRMFVLADEKYWFGGGCDLTPYMPDRAVCEHFHGTLKDALGANHYADGKAYCDKYFYLQHRGEMRGAGGVFFDHLQGDLSGELTLMKTLGEALIPSWLPLARDHGGKAVTTAQKQFQQYRHGRYVEFNLLYDRGTAFGLQTGGQVEAIFMSLPRHVLYMQHLSPEVGSMAHAMKDYYQPQDWAS